MLNKIELSFNKDLLIYKKGYSVEFVRGVLESKGLDGIKIFCNLKDQILDDLSFLKELSFIRKLELSSIYDFDFSFLSSFSNLEELAINVSGSNIIDLSFLKNLKSLTLTWRNNVSGLNKLNLSELILVDLKGNADFSFLNEMVGIRILNLKTGSLKSLDGLENLDNLEILSLGNCSKLSDISALENCSQLKEVYIEGCSKIQNYNFIKELLNLNTLEFIDCKEIKSLNFLSNLNKLESISLLGNTKVVDGDMGFIKNVKNKNVRGWPHYNIDFDKKSNFFDFFKR